MLFIREHKVTSLTLIASFLVVIALTVMTMPRKTHAQSVHGILASWTAATIPPGGAAIAGYNLWMATSAQGPFTKLNSSPITGTEYNVGTGLLSTSTPYWFYVVTQDVNGNFSPPSNTATATTPNAWPVNPNAPASCTVKIQ